MSLSPDPSSSSSLLPLRQSLEAKIRDSNIVSVCYCAAELDLSTVSCATWNVRYNHDLFRSAVWQNMDNPRAALNIFKSGRVVIVGAKQPDDAWKVVYGVFLMYQKRLGIRMRVLNLTEVNNVRHINLGFAIHFAKFLHKHELEIVYDKAFAGATWRIQPEGGLSLVVFETGQIVICGAFTQSLRSLVVDRLMVLHDYRVAPQVRQAQQKHRREKRRREDEKTLEDREFTLEIARMVDELENEDENSHSSQKKKKRKRS
jgi:TATA-box binding protein (TBP) (component of TFIID and TFIIIB)